MKRILLMGSFGAGNLGDEGILEASHNELSKNHHVELCEHFPFGVRSFLKFKWPRTIIKVFKADALIFPGGGLFAEHESLKAILLWSWQVFCTRALRTPVYFLGQSAGPIHTKLGRLLTKCSFKRAKFIATRDADSQELLQSLMPHKNITRFTDTCFLFEAKQNKAEPKTIALELRQWAMNLTELQKQIDSLQKEGFKVHFIASDETDLKLLTNLSGFHSVHLPESFPELIELLTNYEAAIGMRLHFIIASALASCKIHALSYAPKVAALMNKLDLPFTNLGSEEINLMKAQGSLKKASQLNKQKKEALAMFEALPL